MRRQQIDFYWRVQICLRGPSVSGISRNDNYCPIFQNIKRFSNLTRPLRSKLIIL